ncbi:MAG: hypothetical protein OEM60_15870 [Gammaproteobacteria bacterium]|nr:hypothetical protein [Gammaproteobacteria bacterium]
MVNSEGRGLRRALSAAAALASAAIPLAFVSRIPESNTDLSGDGSIIETAVFVIFAAPAAMAVVTLVALLFSSIVSAIFRRRHVFDNAAGEFVRR